MGQEFAQDREWNHDASLDWELLDRPRHQGVRRLVADLNRLYALQPALHSLDFEVEGFSWRDCHDSAQSVLSFIRRAGPAVAVVVLNFTPIPRFKYRIGVRWRASGGRPSTPTRPTTAAPTSATPVSPEASRVPGWSIRSRWS
jgi:1,4-alpha-glucan branching enzyme